MEVTFILIDIMLLNALSATKRIIISVQNIKKNLMAILLVVLPNSTILGPSKPKTLAPVLWWNHLPDDPYGLSLGKAVLYF